ncbi:MAG: hypothetical protein AMXMBFR46_09520 [Acidimicrobiia bacterium]
MTAAPEGSGPAGLFAGMAADEAARLRELLGIGDDPPGPPIATAHDLSRRITERAAARLAEAEQSSLRGIRLPRVFAGHAVDSDATAKLIATTSLLVDLGVTQVQGVDLTEATVGLFADLDPDATEAFSSFTVGEAALRLGGLSAVPDPEAVLRATRTPRTVAQVRAGELPPNWVVVVARCLHAEAALTGEEPPELAEFLGRVTDLFATVTGWVNDGIGDLTMYDAYTPDMYLFAEPLASEIGDGWRTGLRRVLSDLDDLVEPGGAVVWGRSIGALGLSLTVELAALAARPGMSDRPGVWLERSRLASAELDRWFPGGVIAAHQGRNEMFYRGPARRLQMTFDVMDKLLTSARWLRDGAPVPLAGPADAWPDVDRLVVFADDTGAAAWTHRSHAVSFVLPNLRGWSTDYLPSLRGSGLFESPTSGHPCFLPVVRVGDDTLVPADLAVAIDHRPGGLDLRHAGWAPPGMTAAAEQAVAGARHATYTVEGRTVRVHDQMTFDAAAVDRIDSVSILVPELTDRPLDVSVEMDGERGAVTVLRIDTAGVAEWRSFWSELPVVHQIEVPVAPEIDLTWRVRPQVRVASSILYHGYDASLYGPLAGRCRVGQAPWPGGDLVHLVDRLRGFDVLHMAWPEWWSGTDPTRTAEVLDAVRASGVKVVWTMHNLLPHRWKTEDAAASYQQWALASDGVIHHSEWGRVEALATYEFRPDTLHLVNHHGHWGARFRAVDRGARAAIERELGWEPCAIRLAVIGSAREEKDLQMVIDAFHACARDDLQLVIRIAGHENVPDDPRIHVDHEPLPEKAFVRRMGAIDVLVMPFASRGMLTTGTAFDAIGAGVPAITSSWGFFDDVFAGADIRYGESAEDLRRCLDALTPERVEAARLATVARRTEFDWAPIADRHLAFLEAVTDR